jgi:uncharacterized protein HemY
MVSFIIFCLISLAIVYGLSFLFGFFSEGIKEWVRKRKIKNNRGKSIYK